LGARTNIEAGLVKAQQIALSLGVLHDMWDLGKGTGSRKAADETYKAGLENHKFNKRPALPLTVTDKLEVAKTNQANAAAANPAVAGVKGGNNSAVPNPEEAASSTSI
jgi:hypothetical protein